MSQEMSLSDIVKTVWSVKWIVLAGLCIGLLAALLFIYLSTPSYRATMIIAPADGYALGDYASAIEHDRVAAMPFWRPKANEGASPDFHRFIHTMRGAAAADILFKDNSILIGINQISSYSIQTPEALSEYLEKEVKIDPMGATPLRKIHYNHPDPDFAVALLRKLHLVADQMIRRDRRKQSQSRIDYLKNMLQKTLNPDHRKGITNLLMQQENIQMLANLDEAYAAIIVEPASASPRPVWPNRPLFLLCGGVLGGIIGFAFGTALRRHPA